MSDPTSNARRPVSFRKGAAAGSPAPAGPDGGAAKRPNTVLLAMGALVLSGLCAVGAAASLFHLRGWLDYTLRHPTKKPKKPLTTKQIHDQVASIPGSQLIASIVVLVAVSLVAWTIWKGRYWARWAVIAIWVLSTFTGTLAGINSLLAVGTSIPNAFKVPAAFSALFLLAAVVLVLLRPSGAYFALTKPAPRPGAPARRGLFAPRPPLEPRTSARTTARNGRTSATATATTRPAADDAAERARTKKRTNTASVAKGADLARTRAKAASKSRRTEG